MRDPSAVIQRILAAVDLAPDDAWLNALPTAGSKPPENNRERHRYSLSQFGVKSDDVRRRFTDYIKTYDLAS